MLVVREDAKRHGIGTWLLGNALDYYYKNYHRGQTLELVLNNILSPQFFKHFKFVDNRFFSTKTIVDLPKFIKEYNVHPKGPEPVPDGAAADIIFPYTNKYIGEYSHKVRG